MPCKPAPPAPNYLQFARVYTPLILLLCLAMAVLPWLLLSDPAAQRVSRRRPGKPA